MPHSFLTSFSSKTLSIGQQAIKEKKISKSTIECAWKWDANFLFVEYQSQTINFENKVSRLTVSR